jgi:hypothetical protein
MTHKCNSCDNELETKTFRIHWHSGDPTDIEGYDIQHAMTMAGYGGGIMRAVDYWEELKDKEATHETPR